MSNFMLCLFQGLMSDSWMLAGVCLSWMQVRPLMFVSRFLFPLMVVTLMVESLSSIKPISLSMHVGSLGFGPLT